jgi:putative membrane protein
MRTLIAATALIAVTSTVVTAQQKAPAEATKFATKVAAANTFEIQSSELAKKRATRGDVKSFATKMIDDHTKAGREFKTAVQAANVPPPKEQPDAKQKATLAKLQNATGTAFDQSYVSAQLKAHKEAVALFRNYARVGKAAPLKTFAQKTLPTLEDHLAMAQELARPGGVAGKQPPKAGGRAIGPPVDRERSQK